MFVTKQIAEVGPGSNGEISEDNLKKRKFLENQKEKVPLSLLKILSRLAEDAIWINETKKAERIFKFLVTLTGGREDAPEILKSTFIFEVCKMTA